MFKQSITNSFILLSAAALSMASCDTKSKEPTTLTTVEAPETYTFTRDGKSTVSFSGQTDRIQMSEELTAAMKANGGATETSLLEMFRNQKADGSDASPFTSESLNSSSKSIKEKVAASKDYYSSNTTESAAIKKQLEDWVKAQATDVFPNWQVLAKSGVAGQIADGDKTRYVSGSGFEYNQLVGKGLIGSLMLDQIANNYLSAVVLDEGTNRTDNENGVVGEGKNYTNMEHKWDEAYGYVFGNSPNPENPLANIEADDDFLNKYLRSVDGDSDFAGIAKEVFDAFKLGRAAIVAGDYELRDQQANIIRERLSKVVGIRAVYYLQKGKEQIEAGNRTGAFHSLSEGVGFTLSLRFTRNPATNSPYLPSQEILAFVEALTKGNGFWEVSPELLGQMSGRIASQFGFTEAQVTN